MIATYLWIALGGALGSMARFWVGVLVAERIATPFQWGTIFINIVGSFVIGFFGALTGPGGRVTASINMRAFVMVGICGGFTTFSAFSLQTLDLARANHWDQAAGNVALSVAACFVAVWAGHVLGQALAPGK